MGGGVVKLSTKVKYGSAPLVAAWLAFHGTVDPVVAHAAKNAARPAAPAPAHAATVSAGATSHSAGIAIAFARAQLGKPYLWGGTGPDAFDCSGLVQAAWAAAGVHIPRTSQGQFGGLRHITAAQLQPGDLVFYRGALGPGELPPGHVVMYLGGGYVIQAYATGYPIKISPLASLNSAGLIGYARP
jgi:cell wall-associated NlpC family hydrolase